MATCHLQLGRQLHEAGRFSRSDFLMLLSSETKSLHECIECLSNSREGTQEAIVQYRAQGAIHEAECMNRILLQEVSETKIEENAQDANMTSSEEKKEVFRLVYAAKHFI